MPKRLHAHLSPSMAVALLALFVALSGTGYAALKVNGRVITKGSIPGNRLKANSVGGGQVNEARLGTVPRAANADTLAGLSPGSFLQDPSAFLGAGAKAADSEQLDGLNSSAFLGAAAKASDAERLDGIDSTGFVRGLGNVTGQSVAILPGTNSFLGSAIGGLVRFRYTCPAALASNGTLRITNSSTSVADLFVDSGGANPVYQQLGNGGFIDFPASFDGDSFRVQIQGAPGVVAATVATAHRAGDCHAQALGVLGQ